MRFTQTLRAVSGAALAGALVLASAPLAAADQIRDGQWPLKAWDAQDVWKISTGKGVIVAVIDQGVYAQHPDLQGSVIEGKSFIGGSSTSPPSGELHGTAMASDIAAHGHGPGSSDGVMGLAPGAKILAIRDDGSGPNGFGPSIRYAVDHGASVINISEFTTQDFPGEAEAVDYALKKDVLIVSGTGNNGQGPADWGFPVKRPGVLPVGAVKNSLGEIWGKSNYGPGVLLTAPGVNIVNAGTVSGPSEYQIAEGTSDSTAYVSAAVALLRAKFPKLTVGQLVNRLTKTAGLPTSAAGISLPDPKYGYGFIRPYAALTRNIPAGPKYGPLSVPASLKTQSASTQPSVTSPDSGQSAASGQSSSSHTLVLAGLGLGVLIVLALIILLIVKVTRRNKNNGGGQGGGPGGYAPPTPGYPPYGQQPPQQNPYAQPQPNPYQQPTQQPPGQWPNQ